MQGGRPGRWPDRDERRLRGAATGIGHTRWATHGAADDGQRAPAHRRERPVALVHNGIIENVDELRDRLTATGVTFASETDTEVLAHLVARRPTHHLTLSEAVREALRGVEGTYGLLVLDATEPDVLVAARNGSPLVLGIGDGEMFVASDVVRDRAPHQSTGRTWRTASWPRSAPPATPSDPIDGTATAEEPSARRDEPTTSASSRDFMDKEINEQPDAVAGCCAAGSTSDRHRPPGRPETGPPELLRHPQGQVPRLRLRLLRGPAGRRLIEEPRPHPRRRRTGRASSATATRRRPGLPLRRGQPVRRNLRHPGRRARNYAARAALVIGAGQRGRLGAGPGVRQRHLPARRARRSRSRRPRRSPTWRSASRCSHCSSAAPATCPRPGPAADRGLRQLPRPDRADLEQRDQIAAIADRYADAEHMFFIGRVRAWPTAREGAQKLKEISYVHAEAYQASNSSTARSR